METYLAARFLLNSNFKFSSNMFIDSQNAYKKYFGIIDSGDIGQSWIKRNKVFLTNSPVKFFQKFPKHELMEINYSIWYSILRDLLDLHELSREFNN